MSFRGVLGAFWGGECPKARSTSVIPPVIPYKTKMTMIMVSEFLVMHKTGPKGETVITGGLLNWEKTYGDRENRIKNWEKRCKSHGQCCQRYLLGSLALDDLTLNNLIWAIIIWSIDETWFSAHTMQPDDLLHQSGGLRWGRCKGTLPGKQESTLTDTSVKHPDITITIAVPVPGLIKLASS